MAEVNLEFIYQGNAIKVQCKRNEFMKDIFKRYLAKIKKDINTLYLICNGNKINEEVKLEEISNKDNEIKILVYDINGNNIKGEEEVLKQNKDIICPECGNICLIDIKDYKIILNKCIKKHSVENILLNEYNDFQNKTKLNIVCSKCNKNKKEIYGNKLYKCCNCKINICPLCQKKHIKDNKGHIIIDYELKNYLSNVHGEKYISYCEKCNMNLCDICEIEHKNHNYYSLSKLIINKENNINELRIKIDNLKKEINDIINKFNKIINNLEIYYDINNNITNNYNIKNKNYEILMNLNNIYKNNELIIKDINQIINEKNIENKIKYIFNIYNKMITKKESEKNNNSKI